MGHEQQERVPLGFGNLHASPGDHIGHFYRTDEEETSVLVSFIQAGLQAREKCIALISEGRRRRKLEEALQAADVDRENAVASGQLVLDAGKSEPQELRDLLAAALSEIPGRYPLLRWAGVMSWALKKMPTTERLMEWETHCNTIEEPSAIFLCQYELNTFMGTVVMDAMATHPVCIISNAIHQNPYYENPEAYLERLRQRDATSLA